MASSSCPKQSSVPMNHISYPSPLAKYDDVVSSQKLFMDTLENLHSVMGTKFMIPIIGGKDLDLHKLFVEVTSRGGIEKIIRERRWKEVTATFSFPPTATNASFVLRKYYSSLLYHYEQIYYFKAQGQIHPDSFQSLSARPVPAEGTVRPSLEIQAVKFAQPRTDSAHLPGVAASSVAGSRVTGVIDGKFDNGYLVTVKIGSETLKGVLYQIPQPSVPQNFGFVPNNRNNNFNAPMVGTKRRRRRKKSEMKRRDPAHPKPNRSGYNFFFAEQHARLKLIHSGKDREISRMIGELWNKLNEQEKAVYQEKALKDKERYRIEMEDYRERLGTGQIISHAVPLQQCLPKQDRDMVEAEEPVQDDSSDPEDYQNCDTDPETQEGSRSPSGTNPLDEPADSELPKGDDKGENLGGALSGVKEESAAAERF